MAVTEKRYSVATTEWMKVVPRQATENYTHSLTFTKQLTTIAISTITYLRSTFSEDSFFDEKFEGFQVMIIKKECRDELAQFTITSLTQAFEAIEKKYLHRLALCFYENEYAIENLKEYYVLEYSYTTDGVIALDVTSRDSVRQSVMYSLECVRERTTDLIRRCVVVTQALRKLPAELDIGMRLYYNDNAPDGYQAPGFLSLSEKIDHLDARSHGSVKIGSVGTWFHKLKLHAFLPDEFSREPAPSSNGERSLENGTGWGESEGSDVGSSAKHVDCACGLQDLDLTDTMLTCEYCGQLQHAACSGRRGAAGGAAGGAHCCLRCGVNDPKRPFADPKLLNVKDNNRQWYCVMRRVLAWCGGRVRAGRAALADRFQLQHVHAVQLLKLLHLLGVLDAQDPRTSSYKIVPSKLEEVMSRYFYVTESEVMDRLVAESLSPPVGPHDPQGPHGPQDPLAHALRPQERAALHQATALGKMIEPPKTDVVMADATLKQYREAINSNQPPDDTLPLSGDHNPVPHMETLGKGTKRKGAENRRPGINKKLAKKLL